MHLTDAVDLVPFLCGHYLRQGLSRVAFVDDGSTDGTYERLQLVAERSRGRVTVQQAIDVQYAQSELFSQALNALIEEGSRLIVPFDADEFWNFPGDALAQLAGRLEARQISGRWINFVQKRNRTYPAPLGLFSIEHRVPRSASATMDEVLGFEQPFIHVAAHKIAVWTDRPVRIARGQHELLEGPQQVDPTPFEIFHVPIRYKSELTKRGLNYGPRILADRDLSVSWQSRFHRAVVINGRREEVWAANSVDEAGCLDVYGRQIALEPDQRLRRILFYAAMHFARSNLLPMSIRTDGKTRTIAG